MDLTSKKRKAAAEENGSFDAPTDASAPKLLPEDARRLMEPLSRDQILDILQDAACRHTDVLDAVRGLVDGDVSLRKLFIRGLGWDTTTESLRSLFSTYGDLQEAIVIVDKASGKSKGYGFITFRHVDGALIALKEPSKLIDGRMTVTQLASSGGTGGTGNSAPVPAADVALRKVYVGNVPFDMPAERLLKNFLVYGEIEEGPLGYDKATGKSKGYALFVFKTPEGANAALEEPVKRIEGHQVTCKLAIDGKKAKGGVGAGPVPPGGPGGAGPVPLGLGAAGVGVDAAVGFGAGRGSGSFAGGGAGSYVGSGYASNGGGGGAGMQVGQVGIGGHHYSLSSNLPSSMGMGSSGLTAGGGQAAAAASSLGSGGFGVGFYGGSSQFGGLGAGGLGAGGGLGGGAGGLGGGAAALGAGGGGLGSGGGYGGGLGFGGSHYQLQQGSSGIGSGGFPEGGPYGHSASALQGQHQQGAGSPPGSRIPPRGGMYQQGIPPYY